MYLRVFFELVNEVPLDEIELLNHIVVPEYFYIYYGNISYHDPFYERFSIVLVKKMMDIDRSLFDYYIDELKDVFKLLNEYMIKSGYITNEEMMIVIKKLFHIEFEDNGKIFNRVYDDLYTLASHNPILYKSMYEKYIHAIENIKYGNISEYNCVVFDKTKHQESCDICMEPYFEGQYLCMVHPSTFDKHILCGFCARFIKNCPFCRSDIEKKIN